MISADQWRAYNAAVESIREGARSAVEGEVAAWLAANPDATVAEAREEAKRIMRGAVQDYDRSAAALAAEWYDAQGRANGARLDRAVTAPAFSDAQVDRVARYKASRLVEGDPSGFAAGCGSFAANSAMRSLNDTILRNVRRDRKKGVRYARVTSGRNTCAFCLMLAGRGAVYWTRESAGALNRWHDHCTCKVVPGYSGDPKEVLVEGHDPAKIEARLREVERLTGAKPGTPEFSREVEMRDPDWLFGDEIEVSYEGWSAREKRKLADHEKREHSLLAKSGLRVFPIPTDRSAPANIDLWMNGEFWELKSVTGDERRVGQRLDEAVTKWDRLHELGLSLESTPKVIVDNTHGKASDDVVLRTICAKMAQYSDKGFDQAIFMGKDGTIALVKK
ncbi:hypothetical protein [Paratractidigestivibacter faecalis]|uniref:tRNA nuclease CdiA C-terminal domain-containing protein n=1 Tax=Paratractidigestivibacter faecalis TaxID=2292441 RepID=A0ABV1IDQ6_9ACTN